MQLVLTDRTALTQNWVGGIVSLHLWRFADLSTRLDFLLAGFGRCNMPSYMVTEHIAAGRLKKLNLANREDEVALPIYVVHDAAARRAGRALANRRSARAPQDLSGAFHPPASQPMAAE